ncbi:redox-regulated ATPase YchF [Candidatus Woesearchaeota archaeon]|jgi:ribosome-binding ATPase|nr:redox-regulated ATPase YchF [Candidatus Woesearchaeota archaeon]
MIVGVVGKPNVGKSTLFKAATLAEVEIANYPFATIKPNTGVGYVKVNDVAREFGKVSNPRNGYVLKESRFVPVQAIDVAGLVPGAHEGLGLGNQFLDDLRQADVLIHVVDCSGGTNEKGESIEPGSYDPVKDVEFLELELDMWYLGILKKGWEKFSRIVMQEKKEIDKALGKQLSGLKITEEMVEDSINELELDKEKPSSWTNEELLNLAQSLRKKTKPMIIACNKIDVNGAMENFVRLKDKFSEYIFIGCSAESELALREAAKMGVIEYVPGEKSFSITETGEGMLNEKQKNALNFISENVLKKEGTGVQQVLDKAVFELLGYIAIFPGGASKLEDKDGNVLPDCFLMPPDSTALDFAFKLHTDFGKNFIRAIDVRTKMAVGKEHKLKHLDILEIVAGR